jgi:uncharacterized protein YjbI with pentapeptide repeats
MDGAYLSRTDLSGTKMSGVSMCGAVLTSVRMEPVVQQRRDGKGTKLVKTDLTNADLTGVQVAYTSMHKARLEGLKHDGIVTAIAERMDRLQPS